MISVPGFKIDVMLYTGKRFSVYRALRIADQQKVILKCCLSDHPPAQDLGTLQHEYQILKQVSSTEVVHAYELVEIQNRLVLVFEDMGGVTLRQLMQGKPLELERFFLIALKTAKGLEDIHHHNIIHKDINPDNIVINIDTQVVKLVDFSIASQLVHQAYNSLQILNLEGTLNYIAPEQTGRMNRPLDYRADFYSLGITFYEMLAGKLPFESDDPLELIHCHLARNPEPLNQINPSIPLMLDKIVHKLVSKTAEDRYISAQGLYRDLEKCYLQWQEKKEILSFELGEEDRPTHLIISPKLYGRETQLTQLLDAFNRISKGGKEMLFIAGASGIGKSSLVKEIYPSVTRQHSYFVSGKYDLLNQATPYSAIIEAFQELVKLLLAEPEYRFNKLKDDLSKAVGNNGQVIAQVIPQINLILGEQPPVSTLPPRESQNRFMLTFQNFVRALAQPEHPLVIFLDDLQWADSASLQLIESILQDPSIENMLILGAYRKNYKSSDTFVASLQKRLDKAKVQCGNLLLSHLKETDIQNLLYDTLGCDKKESTADLAATLFNKTHGNPYFLNQLLKKLYQENILFYDNSLKHWVWDDKRIHEMDISDNVVDILSTQIRRLSAETQTILKLAACIGHSFDLYTLSLISEQPVLKTAQAVWQTVQTGLLFPIDKNYQLLERLGSTVDQESQAKEVFYRFSHDKIQKTAYQMIDDSQRSSIHLQIGRLLKGNGPLQLQDKSLFEIVGHFNKSLSLLTDQDEKLQIAEGNLWAGIRAKAATAYNIADEYLNAGIQLLPEDAWKEHYNLCFALHKERAECQYLTVNYDDAQAYFNMLLMSARSFKDMMEVYKLQIIMLNTLNQPSKALEMGIKALQHLNIFLPLKPSRFAILKLALKIQLKTGFKPVQEIQLEQATDHKIKYLNDICQHLFTSAYIYDQQFFALLVLTLIDYSLSYGYTPAFSYICYCYGYILIHVFNRYQAGINYIELGKKTSQPKLSPPNVLAREHAVLALLIDQWQEPFKASYENAVKAQDYAIQDGDLVYANIAAVLQVTNLYRMRQPLSEYTRAARNALVFQERHNLLQMRLSLQLGIRFSEMLQDADASYEGGVLPSLYETFPELGTIDEQEDKTETSSLYNVLIKLCYHLGTTREAVEIAYKQPEFARFTSGSSQNAEAIFYSALAFFAADLTSTASEQEIHRRFTKAAYKKFRKWAEWCPVNFRAHERLLAAELARVERKNILAMELYDQAVKAADEADCLYLPAIVNECASRFYLQIDKPFIARSYMQIAHYAYGAWGAIGKVKMLEKEFSEWLYSASLSNNPASTLDRASSTLSAVETPSLDISVLLKSMQAIASEIRLDKLIDTLLNVLLQSSGAQRAVLILKEREIWVIKAEGQTETDQPLEILDIPLKDYDNLPLSLISYVQRTREKILVNQEKELEIYKSDNVYLQEANPQSVLVLPLVHQGEISSILYLENRSTAYAFPAPHLHTLELLASQAAISLTNANLYYQATHDQLTKLPNRNLLYQIFTHASSRAKRHNKSIAILFLDLDGFKKINDTLGHEIGDKVLQYFAEQLLLTLRAEDLAARLGGDEFIVMLEDITDPVQATFVAERILKQINKSVEISGHNIKFGTSIGISLYPQDSLEIATLLKKADTALYEVKEAGRGHYKFFQENSSA